MNSWSHLYLEWIGINIYICPFRIAVKTIKEQSGQDYDLNLTTAGHCVKIKNQIFILFNEENLGPNIIAHEAFHATTYILREYLECKNNHNSEEVYAYLHAWIVQKIHETINDKLTNYPEDLYYVDEPIWYPNI